MSAITITCHCFDHLPLSEITEFQGKLKKRTPQDLEKITASLRKHGFTFPFYIWKHDGVNHCLDGHGRLLALKQMQEAGEELPEFPVVYVDADDEKDAKTKLLQVNSQYGRIDADELQNFALDIDLDQFQLPELGKAAFIFEKIKTEEVGVVQLFSNRIVCSVHEKELIQEYTKRYFEQHGNFLGFFSRLFGKDNNVDYGEFVEEVDIDTIQGADYNPRAIDKKKIEQLAESIQVCGFCRPVIVNRRNGIIIAGHQRTKASKHLGIKKVPVYYTYASEQGEMRINQIHNALEDNKGSDDLFVPPSDVSGFADIRYTEVTGGKTHLTRRAYEFGQELLRYGNIDSGVATAEGQVIKNIGYVTACRALCCPARIYYLPKGTDKERAKFYLYGEYGKFSYAGKDTHSFQQTFAQLSRRHTNPTTLYEWLRKNLPDHKQRRILDFAAGEAVEITLLKKQGADVTSLEFFPRLRTVRNDRIDTHACDYDVHRLIQFCEERLFDLVICDSVLNSVVNNKAERDVVNCLNIFCRMGGEAVFSSRAKYQLELDERDPEIRTSGRGGVTLNMADEEGRTGLMRNGKWFFQKFHSPEQLIELSHRSGFEVIHPPTNSKALIHVRKVKELPIEVAKESIYNEFNMYYSDTERYNHADKMWEVLYRKYYSKMEQ